ncbi:MAG: hypothetical protein HYY02_11060 [Chloroflexi bacterium]|nr:hypothetical protein [Chloroflexota bacterium]
MADLLGWAVSGLVLGLSSLPLVRFPKPRTFWGAPWAEAIGFPWAVGFLTFGPVVGMLSAAVGALGVWRLSPGPGAGLEAVSKLAGAWGWMVAVALAVVLYWGGRYPPPPLISFQLALAAALLTGAARGVVLIPLEGAYIIPRARSLALGRAVARSEAMAEFGGVYRFVFVQSLYHLWAALLDFMLPWVVLFPTGLARALVA